MLAHSINAIATVCAQQLDKMLCVPCWIVGNAQINIAEYCAKQSGGKWKLEGRVRYTQEGYWVDVNAFRWG